MIKQYVVLRASLPGGAVQYWVPVPGLTEHGENIEQTKERVLRHWAGHDTDDVKVAIVSLLEPCMFELRKRCRDWNNREWRPWTVIRTIVIVPVVLPDVPIAEQHLGVG